MHKQTEAVALRNLASKLLPAVAVAVAAEAAVVAAVAATVAPAAEAADATATVTLATAEAVAEAEATAVADTAARCETGARQCVVRGCLRAHKRRAEAPGQLGVAQQDQPYLLFRKLSRYCWQPIQQPGARQRTDGE